MQECKLTGQLLSTLQICEPAPEGCVILGVALGGIHNCYSMSRHLIVQGYAS
jgi:hypothetical protein